MQALQPAQQYLPGVVLGIVKLGVWLVLLSAVFVPLERLFAIRPQKLFRRQFGVDLGYYFLSGLVPSLLLGTPMALLAWAVHTMLPNGINATVAQWPTWLRIAAAMVVGEIGFYWGHRWSHEIPLLWQFHAIHHSAENIDWLVNTRAHPVDMVFTRLCGFVPLYILGLAAPLAGIAGAIPMLVLLLGMVWGFFVHANLRWRFGPLEWVLATPAFHHWHHTNDGPAYVDKNYAPMLPWVDYVFGTFHLPKVQRPSRYGTDHPVPSGLFAQLLEPFMWRLPGAPHPAEPRPPPGSGEARSQAEMEATRDHDLRLATAAADDLPRPGSPYDPHKDALRTRAKLCGDT
jgi:sterol desaturase/sphingolipid hydroxylase (fatty acid hydroxylase superfamily)